MLPVPGTVPVRIQGQESNTYIRTYVRTNNQYITVKYPVNINLSEEKNNSCV